MEFNHTSVLLRETVDSVVTNPKGIYVDCTGGEHRHQPDDGAEPGTPADGGVVAAHDPAAAEKL